MKLIKKIYNEVIIEGNGITIDGEFFSIVKGKHSIWIPKPEMKIPWSYNGKITSFRDWDKGEQAKEIQDKTFNDNNRYWDKRSLQSIMNEYLIFKGLAELVLAPPIKGMFYVKNMVSDFYPGTTVCDSKGVFGYYMRNAYGINETGHYTFTEKPSNYGYYSSDIPLPDRFTNHILPLLNISDSAKGDMRKEDNVIDGYIIEMRRSLYDMMTLKDLPKDSWKQIEYKENDMEELKEKIAKLTQFPHKERKENYQSYYLDGEEVVGARNTNERMKVMGIPEEINDYSILDLGCNLGSVACECWKRGARHVMGLDNEADYIDCARDLARHNGYNINYMCKDLTKVDDVVIYINSFFKQTKRPINIIFALSLYKHIKEKMFEVLERLKWHECYIESNNAPQGEETPHVKEIIAQIEKRGWKHNLQGIDSTRSPRCIWKITKK